MPHVQSRGLGTGIALSALSKLLEDGKRCKGVVLEAETGTVSSSRWVLCTPVIDFMLHHL